MRFYESPPKVFFKNGVLKNFAKYKEDICAIVSFFIEVAGFLGLQLN